MKLFQKDWTIISPKDQKNSNYTLYLYAEKIENTVYVKFGEAFKQSVWDRYNDTGDTQHLKQIYVWKSQVGDKAIHSELKKLFNWAGNKKENPLNTNEAYIVESDEEIQKIINVISNFVKNQKIGPDFYRERFAEKAYIPREYQYKVMERAKVLLKQMDRILINLSTRAGKSYVSLKTCKDLKAKNILILTPFPSAEDSFEHLANYNEEFAGYKYIHLNSNVKTSDFYDKNIIFCSYQYYDEDKKNIKFIKQLDFDFVILDECHNTSDSKRTQELLKKLNYKKIIYMSGTPFNDIYSNYFKKDEVITFDFIDFIKFAKKHPDQVKLPNLHIKNVCNIAQLQNTLLETYPEIFKEADAFDYSTIFSDEQHAEAFFTWLLQPVKANKLIINKKRWFDLSQQKRIIAFFTKVSETHIAKSALQKLLPDYDIYIISGDSKKDLSSTDEATINGVFEKEKTIILTCGKLTTGVTLPKLDTIWYFKNSSSSEQFIQILFRCMTPCEGKTDATMYCFDSETSLKVVKEYAAIRLNEMSTNVTKQDNDTFKSVMNDIYSCINFTYLNDKLEWTDETPETLFEKLHKLPYSYTVISVFRNFQSFNDIEDLHTEELKEKDLIITQPQKEAIKGQCEYNKSKKEFDRLFKKSQKSNNTNSSNEKDSDKVVKQLLKLMINFDKKILIDDSIKNYIDLVKLMPKELKAYENNYKQLLEDNKNNINQMIEDIRWKKEHDIKNLLNGLSYSNVTDQKTPDELCKKMWEKFLNPNLPVFDPCAGTGNLLTYGVEHYGIKPEDCWAIDIEPDNVAILKMLGYNAWCGDATNEKLLLEVKQTMEKKYEKKC